MKFVQKSTKPIGDADEIVYNGARLQHRWIHLIGAAKRGSINDYKELSGGRV
ncbi:hypothetical protein [Paenibacillus fonticola]|uniref:hypothetical protein n=1 Tax=Paenibacillus fonticola TaxID=379896 RepID=UPI00039CD749|nr:hypothetical protein [Paenibacillus fonticola]